MKQNRIVPSKEFLEQEYTQNQKSTTTIGKTLGCSAHKVNDWLRKYNIPLRTTTEGQNTDATKNAKSEGMKNAWSDPEQREIFCQSMRAENLSPQARANHSAGRRKSWIDNRENHLAGIREKWKDPAHMEIYMKARWNEKARSWASIVSREQNHKRLDRKLPQLSFNEEKFLFGLAQSGDERARQKLINRNLGLAHIIAAKIWNNIGLIFPNINIVELDISKEIVYQEAYLALIETIDKFDTSRGKKFSTLAMIAIPRKVKQALMDTCRIVRVPQYKNWDNDGLRSPILLREVSESIDQKELYILDDPENFNWFEELFTHETEIFAQEPLEIYSREFRMDILKIVKEHPKGSKRRKDLLVILGSLIKGEDNNAKIAERVGLTRERVRQVIKESAKKIFINE